MAFDICRAKTLYKADGSKLELEVFVDVDMVAEIMAQKMLRNGRMRATTLDRAILVQEKGYGR